MGARPGGTERGGPRPRCAGATRALPRPPPPPPRRLPCVSRPEKSLAFTFCPGDNPLCVSCFLGSYLSPSAPSPASHLRSLWAPWAPRHRRGCWEKLGSSRCWRPGQNDPGLSLKGSVALSKGLDHSESPPYKGVRMPGGVTARMTSLPAHGAPRSVPGASSTRSSVFPWGPLPRH